MWLPRRCGLLKVQSSAEGEPLGDSNLLARGLAQDVCDAFAHDGAPEGESRAAADLPQLVRQVPDFPNANVYEAT